MENNMNEYQDPTNGYQDPMYGADAQPPRSDKAKTSKTCGIISIITAFIGWFCSLGYASIPLAIVAIVMAVSSKKETNGVLTKDARTGLTCGIIGLVIMVIGFLIGVVLGVALALNM